MQLSLSTEVLKETGSIFSSVRLTVIYSFVWDRDSRRGSLQELNLDRVLERKREHRPYYTLLFLHREKRLYLR
jgi:hypothetical protein